jgi:hypothetical protein
VDEAELVDSRVTDRRGDGSGAPLRVFLLHVVPTEQQSNLSITVAIRVPVVNRGRARTYFYRLAHRRRLS